MPADGPVVVTLDGSLHDPVTLSWGLIEAELRAAPAVLVRVVEDRDEPRRREGYASPFHAFQSEASASLHRLEERERARRPSLDITTRVVPGPVAAALRSLSATARLLVLGAHGPGEPAGPTRFSTDLAAHSSCPVAFVRAPEHEVHRVDAPVVAGVDGTPRSLDAALVAAREAVLHGRSLVLLHASTHSIDHPGARTGSKSGNAPQHARMVAERVSALVRAEYPGLGVQADGIEQDAADALVERSSDATLVVVGSRGLGAVRGRLLGSVSGEVVRRAHSTVLVVHQP